MAEITAAMVKELRESTGAGMMDCKNALSETNGDFDKAVQPLREQDGEALANEEKEITDEEKKEVLDEAMSEEDFGEEQE